MLRYSLLSESMVRPSVRAGGVHVAHQLKVLLEIRWRFLGVLQIVALKCHSWIDSSAREDSLFIDVSDLWFDLRLEG